VTLNLPRLRELLERDQTKANNAFEALEALPALLAIAEAAFAWADAAYPIHIERSMRALIEAIDAARKAP
jgi:hypothetical protein